MRKLASIQRILSLDPIPGADAIEVASVLGWKCVVKKGDFSVGDPCVYIEVDSMLPERPEFEFMKARGMRVRTMKLRGQISQGLVMPTTLLANPNGDTSVFDDGMDVTEYLGVVKYEPPVPVSLGGEAKGSFPSFIPKTDEDRIQSFPDILTKYGWAECEFREKLDGSSATFYLKDGSFGVCSRNLELRETEGNTFWDVAKQMNIEERLRHLGCNIAIQGELIGPGIQKNKYKLDAHEVRFFNVYDIDAQCHLDCVAMSNTIDELGLKQAPLLGSMMLSDFTVDSLVELSTGPSELNSGTLREGVVVRSLGTVQETFQTPDGPKTVDRGRLSFKVISPAFLLKNEE